MMIPFVIEQTPNGERQYDIYSRLLMDRILFISGEINDALANSIVAQLLFLEAQDDEQDIHLYINSPGGSVVAGLAIYDVMQYIKPDVATYSVGLSASMGALLLTAGTKGKRYAMPHSRIMIHQPLGSFSGQASDIKIQAEEILKMKKELNTILSKHTGKSVKQIEKDTDRDNYMFAQEAKNYGIIDKIIQK